MLSADANTLAVKMVERLTHAHLAPTRPRLRDRISDFPKCLAAPFVISSPRGLPFLATNGAHEGVTEQGNASCPYSVFGSLSVR